MTSTPLRVGIERLRDSKCGEHAFVAVFFDHSNDVVRSAKCRLRWLADPPSASPLTTAGSCERRFSAAAKGWHSCRRYVAMARGFGIMLEREGQADERGVVPGASE